MRYLFISYTFPGPFEPLCSWLARQPGNQIAFAASRAMQEYAIANVQRVLMKKFRRNRNANETCMDLWEEAVKAGRNAQTCYQMLKDSGFVPDMIFNASSSGIYLGIRDIFPNATSVNFLENEKCRNAEQKRIRQEVQLAQIVESDMTFALSTDSLPKASYLCNSGIEIAPLAVDTDFYAPGCGWPQRFEHPQICIVSNGNEYHCWQLCRKILNLLPGCNLVLVLENSFARRKLEQLAEAMSGCAFAIEVCPDPEKLRDLFAASLLVLMPAANKYLPAALSCGACVLASGVEPELASLVIPLLADSPDAQATQAAALLANPDSLERTGKTARKHMLDNFSLEKVMPGFMARIQALGGR